jgi:GT2 family glycosyltransferase
MNRHRLSTRVDETPPDARAGSWSASSPAVSVIIPVSNDALRLTRCLRSVAANGHASQVEVIVVDHGSDDYSAAVAREIGAMVLHATGRGPASLRNMAARRASGDILAFIDADHEIASSWLASAIDALAESDVAAAGAIYQPPADGTWVQRMYGALRGSTHGQRQVEWLGAGNLAVKSDAFARIGGFDTSLETCEDVDLCQRLRKAGYRVVEDDRLHTVHHGDPATLRGLFLGEMWRGRDNIRVSLRGPLSLRGLPSLVVPCLEATIPFFAAMALLLSPRLGLAVLVGGLGFFVSVTGARTAVLLRRLGDWRPVSILRAFGVAATYDLGRAAALIIKIRHRHRRVATEPRISDV